MIKDSDQCLPAYLTTIASNGVVCLRKFH